jgi:5-methylcytosine-specific restriction endonuclease McrA
MPLTEQQIQFMAPADRQNAALHFVGMDIWKSPEVTLVKHRIQTDPDWAAEVLRGVCGVVDGITAASIQSNRVDDWTVYVRNRRWDTRQFDVGIGMEWTMQCCGCGRWCPINSMTAEHVIPKSDWAKILAELILPLDGLAAEPPGPTRLAWEVYCAVNVVIVRNDADIVVNHRSTYLSPISIGLERRNLIGMCASCNSRKGARQAAAKPAVPGGWTPARFVL